jgi:ATP-binding cassette subfamily B protein
MSYLKFWRELLALTFRRLPWMTTAALAAAAAVMVMPTAMALMLRYVVDASAAGDVAAAVAGGVGTGLVYGLSLVSVSLLGGLREQLIDQIGLIDVDTRILSDACGIEGLDHLERTDYLDRITVLRNSAFGLVDSLWGVLQSASGVGQVVIMLLLLGSVNPWLLFLLVFAVIPLWFDQRGRLGVARAETASAEDYRLQRHLFTMTTSGRPDVLVSESGPELVARQVAAWDAAIRVRTRAAVTAALWRAGGWLVFSAGFVAALALVIGQRRTSPGDVVLTITVAGSLRNAVYVTVSRSTATAGYRRLIDPFLWLSSYAARERAAVTGTAVTGTAVTGQGEAPERLAAGIGFDGVTYRYPGTTRPAVDDVTATLPAGSVVAVVGEYGSGKTTLIKLLCKFYRPDAGSITVDGTELAAIDTASWRSRLSVAFQDFGRYRTTMRENVLLGDLGSPGGLTEALRAADADGLVAGLPCGLDTELGGEFGGVDLSEGQWQKTALARACLRAEPLLFVLDEPTASLDAPSEHAIFAHYMARARALGQATGAITIVISHRFSTVSGADQILVMDAGRLAETGSHADLLAAGGRYAELYGIQAAAYTN